MALNAMLRLTGQKQGEIKGNSTIKGRENSIMVVAANHQISSPRDMASGLATGKRMHRPLTITKVVDTSSPLLYMALVKNENITKFKLDFFTSQQPDRTQSTGIEWNYFTIELQNSSICNVSFSMLNNKNPELMRYEEHEEWSFVYEQITWTNTKTGQTCMDSWIDANT
jgi:type VI secretion system secreted protein Hcp